METLVGEEVETSNVTYTGNSAQLGRFIAAEGMHLPFDEGIIMSTGSATSAFNKKDYGAAIQIFRKSLSIDPYNPYAHYMLAKSLYRVKAPKDDEFYGVVLNEIKSAIELAETQNDLADYWDYMAKVLRKLASRNLFNSNNNTDYAGMALQCQARAQQIRQQR